MTVVPKCCDHHVLPNLWLLPLRDLIAMESGRGFAATQLSGAANASRSRTESCIK